MKAIVETRGVTFGNCFEANEFLEIFQIKLGVVTLNFGLCYMSYSEKFDSAKLRG